MTVYHRLYSRTSAAVAVIVASWLLVISQSRVVYDAMGVIHPAWPAYLHAVAAAGYEVATMGCGLVIAVRGGSARLWAGMAVFLAVSSWLGFDAAMRGLVAPSYLWRDIVAADPVTLIRAVLTGAALPAQYLLAVAAGRSLVGDDHAPVITPAQVTAALAPDASRRAGRETPVKRRPGRGELADGAPRVRQEVTADDVATWARMARDGMTAGQIAGATGRSARTIQQRLRAA